MAIIMTSTRLLCGLAVAVVAFGCAKEQGSGRGPTLQAKEPTTVAKSEPKESAKPIHNAASPVEKTLSPKEQELAAYEAAKPVFEEHCAHCHTGDGKSKKGKKALKHFKMDSYPFEGHHAHELGAIVRKVLGVDGGKVTMPKDDKGAVQGKELELVVAWSRAFDAAHQGESGHHGHKHEHKKKGHSH